MCPYARVLSVAGFLATMGRFPGSGWFILRVKREETRLVVPLLFNIPDNVAHPSMTSTSMCTTGRYTERHVRGWATYLGVYTGHIYHPGYTGHIPPRVYRAYTTRVYRAIHTRVHGRYTHQGTRAVHPPGYTTGCTTRIPQGVQPGYHRVHIGRHTGHIGRHTGHIGRGLTYKEASQPPNGEGEEPLRRELLSLLRDKEKPLRREPLLLPEKEEKPLRKSETTARIRGSRPFSQG